MASVNGSFVTRKLQGNEPYSELDKSPATATDITQSNHDLRHNTSDIFTFYSFYLLLPKLSHYDCNILGFVESMCPLFAFYRLLIQQIFVSQSQFSSPVQLLGSELSIDITLSRVLVAILSIISY